MTVVNREFSVVFTQQGADQVAAAAKKVEDGVKKTGDAAKKAEGAWSSFSKGTSKASEGLSKITVVTQGLSTMIGFGLGAGLTGALGTLITSLKDLYELIKKAVEPSIIDLVTAGKALSEQQLQEHLRLNDLTSVYDAYAKSVGLATTKLTALDKEQARIRAARGQIITRDTLNADLEGALGKLRATEAEMDSPLGLTPSSILSVRRSDQQAEVARLQESLRLMDARGAQQAISDDLDAQDSLAWQRGLEPKARDRGAEKARQDAIDAQTAIEADIDKQETLAMERRISREEEAAAAQQAIADDLDAQDALAWERKIAREEELREEKKKTADEAKKSAEEEAAAYESEVINTVGSTAGAFAEAGLAALEFGNNFGKSLANAAKAVAKFNLLKGLEQLAMGIAATVMLNPAAAGHYASAKLHFGVAAAAGAAAAAGGAFGGGGGGGGGGGSAARGGRTDRGAFDSGRDRDSGPKEVVFNLNFSGQPLHTEREIGERVRQVLQGTANMRGMTPMPG